MQLRIGPRRSTLTCSHLVHVVSPYPQPGGVVYIGAISSVNAASFGGPPSQRGIRVGSTPSPYHIMAPKRDEARS